MRPLFSYILVSLFLFSCTTGRKAYERGDYFAATIKAVNRLRSKPDSGKALNALKESYPMALKYYQGKIDQAFHADLPFKYSGIVDYYEMMNRLSDEVSRCPAALRLFPEVNFYDAELSESRELAAAEHYNAALALELENTRDAWLKAYYHYQQADCYVPGYKEVTARLKIARYNATFRVIVEQIRVPQNYQLSADFFLNQVMEDLTRHRPNDFIELYSPASAERAGLTHPDQLLRMNFDEFVIGQIYDKETVKEVSRDSVEVGSVTMPDGTVKKVYNTVRAKLTSYHREIASNGVLDVTIIDLPLNRVTAQRKFPGQFIWYTEWSNFNGDERALSKEQLAMCNSKPVPPPPPQDLFLEFTRPIFSQLSSYLRSFYRKY